jgi:hypothetical protein
MTAFSPKISNLQDSDIAKYFENIGESVSKSGKWMYLENKVGTEIKILKSGIVESENSSEDIKVKDELIRISKDVKTISTNLFGTNPIFNVLISQNPNKCKIFEKINKNKNITALSLTFKKKIHVELKIDQSECQINMYGISDTNDILNIYNGLVSNDEESLKTLNLEHMSIKESVF